LKQNYPSHLFEILVIDDHSTDGTPEWLAETYGGTVRVLHLDHFLAQKEVVAFKKAALTYGVQEAEGDWIITTDADTISQPDWLKTVAFYVENSPVDAVAGPIRYRYDRSLLSQFQALDNAATMLLAAAGLSSGNWALGNGANLAFRKKTFWELDGYEGSWDQPSGDDLFLLQKWMDAGARVGFLKHPRTVVDTFPEPTWKRFWDQRLRWAGKPVGFGLRLIQGGVFGYYLLVLIGLSGGLLLDWEWLWVAMALFFWKAGIDYFWIREGARFLQQDRLMRSYGLMAPLYMLYILWVGSLALMRKRKSWKGRSWK